MATIDGKRVRRGFDPIPCPKCGADNMVMLNLETLGEVHCTECDETTTIDEIRSLINVWAKVLAWIDTAPTVDE